MGPSGRSSLREPFLRLLVPLERAQPLSCYLPPQQGFNFSADAEGAWQGGQCPAEAIREGLNPALVDPKLVSLPPLWSSVCLSLDFSRLAVPRFFGVALYLSFAHAVLKNLPDSAGLLTTRLLQRPSTWNQDHQVDGLKKKKSLSRSSFELERARKYFGTQFSGIMHPKKSPTQKLWLLG